MIFDRFGILFYFGSVTCYEKTNKWNIRPYAMVRFIGILSTRAFRINLGYFGFKKKNLRLQIILNFFVGSKKSKQKNLQFTVERQSAG